MKVIRSRRRGARRAMRPWTAALALGLASCARAAVNIEELSARVDNLAGQLRIVQQMGMSNYDLIQKLAEKVQLEVHENDDFFTRLNVLENRIEVVDLDPVNLSILEQRMAALNEEIDEVDDENDAAETMAALGIALGALGLLLGLAFVRYVFAGSNSNGYRARLTSSTQAASDAETHELAAMSELAVSRYRARPPPAMTKVDDAC